MVGAQWAMVASEDKGGHRGGRGDRKREIGGLSRKEEGDSWTS